MQALKGKVALVTGASRGIGRATALALARAGAAVYLAADGTAEELGQAADECKKLSGADAAFGMFDLADAAHATGMVDDAVARLGGVDILVNNAGIRNRKSFGTFAAEDFDQLMAVNLRAPFLTSQAVLASMRKRGGGRIIHVASQLGLVATENSSLYGTAKAALIYLAKSMAVELAKENISVNAVSPGPVETEFTRTYIDSQPGYRESRVAKIPLGRWGRPEEIADAIVFLASTPASFIHGANLVIDGGYVAH